MFKKLRQKIESVESPSASPSSSENGNPSGLRRNDDARRSSRARINQSNLKRTDSLSSLNGSEELQPTESSTKEDLYSMLMHRTTQVKRLEVKLAEYGQSLKERSRDCEKLTNALEKQQDSALRKLNELNETYNNDKKRSEATITRLDQTERQLSAEVDRLQDENERLQDRVDKWDVQKDEFEKQKSEFYEKRDNDEELHDLQRQELAKLKHMLMNSEKEAKCLQCDLDENVATLLQCQERNDELEASLRESSSLIESTQNTLKGTMSEKDKLSANFSEAETQRKKLVNENADLKDKLSCLALDLQKTRSSLSTVESSRSSLGDKYEYLKHSSEAVLNKAQSDLEEKESLIIHLRDKLKMMEHRSTTENLPQDEQVQALIDERLSLEQKLEESRQQLVNIKSTWADRINQLETQVAHLTAKITEDSEELTQKTKELEQIKKEMSEQVVMLTSQLKSEKASNSDLTSHNEAVLQQLAELEAKLIEQQAMHDLGISKSKKRESDLDEQARNVEKELRTKINKLSEQIHESSHLINSLKTENENASNDKNKQVEALQSEINAMKDDLEKKNIEVSSRERINGEMALSLEEVRCDRDETKKMKDKLQEELHNQQNHLDKARGDIEKLTSDLSDATEKLQDVEKKLEESASKLDVANQELEEKHEGLIKSKDSSEAKEGQLQHLTSKVTELEATLEIRTKELMSCKEEVACLKNNQAEEGEEVKMLKMERSRLEDHILEKDRTLKLHQQRLSDIKKTLQRELNKKKAVERSWSNDSTHPTQNRSTSKVRGDSVSSSSVNGENDTRRQNGFGAEPEADPLPSLLSGDMSLDDPSLSDGQRDVVIKYLKHVVLKFLSCGQSEAQQLIKAISAILHFTPDEEKLVREVLDYRASWFSSRPNTKSIIKPSVKTKGRHSRR